MLKTVATVEFKQDLTIFWMIIIIGEFEKLENFSF